MEKSTSAGQIVIVTDPGFGDEYAAEVLDDHAHGHDPPPNPIVRIKRMIRYPAQRAIMPPHPAHETPPLKAGCICRLPVLRAEGEAPAGDPLEVAIREARTDEERAILERHRRGDVKGMRSVITYTEHDLEWLKRSENHAIPSESLF